MTIDMKWSNYLKHSVKVKKKFQHELEKKVPSHPEFKKSWAKFYKYLLNDQEDICKYTIREKNVSFLPLLVLP